MSADSKTTSQSSQPPKKTYTRYDKCDLSPEAFPKLNWERKSVQTKEDSSTGIEGEKIQYWSSPLIHKTKNANGRYVTDAFFEIEGPLLTSEGGITVKRKGNRYLASVWVSHDLLNEEIKKYCGTPLQVRDFQKLPEETEYDDEGKVTKLGKNGIGFLSELHLRTVLSAYEENTRLGVSARSIDAFEGSFPPIVKWEFDSNGAVQEGRMPSKYYNIYLMGDITKPNHRKAAFSIPCEITKENPTGQKVLPWGRLQECRLKFRPVIRFTHVTCVAAKFSLKAQIMSAVVYGFPKLNSNCEQDASLADARSDAALMSSLHEQLDAANQADPEGDTVKFTNFIDKKDGEGDEKDGKGKGKSSKADSPKNSKSGSSSSKGSRQREDSEERDSERDRDRDSKSSGATKKTSATSGSLKAKAPPEKSSRGRARNDSIAEGDETTEEL